MLDPIGTYRIQFHKGFTFSDFEKVIPYLQTLGVGTIYASPIFEAVPGSMHGYDIINPHKINPEIGTEEQLRSIVKTLNAAGIHWIQDIVPNHMAYHPLNLWLMDVLEKGRYSVYADFFDLSWSGDLFHGRLMAPFLGSPLEEVLASNELQLVCRDSRLMLKYHDHQYPLHSRSYASILNLREPSMAIQQFIDQVTELHQIDETIMYTLRWHELVLQFGALLNQPITQDYIVDCIQSVNEDDTLLHKILDEQIYKLTHWQETNKHISFRRFFTVNGLIGLNVHDDKVFNHYHRYIHSLLQEGIFQGLRVDHVDGLYNPAEYIDRLRSLIGSDVYLAVEKILQEEETLPEWTVQGTTGYEFLAQLNNVLTYRQAGKSFTDFYHSYISKHTCVGEELYCKKSHILKQQMAGEWENLCQLFVELNLGPQEAWKSVEISQFKMCLGEFLIRFPVYRFYSYHLPLRENEAMMIRDLLNAIRKQQPELSGASFLLEKALLSERAHSNTDFNTRAIQFFLRCMQFTGPLMAKGVEDTLMYTYNRFIGHNEVGDSPVSFGLPAESFHQRMKARQEHWPLCMNTTSTHDTKRGEDVRARLQAISAVPEEWTSTVNKWTLLNEPLKKNGIPDANDEYFIYQTIAGAYPFQDEPDFTRRMEEYVVKALREGKRKSNWNKPDEVYEQATQQFVRALLDKNSSFVKRLKKFFLKIKDAAIINSLVQVLLKFTCPGVPDVYQGCESWDFSLVDPDNRRPVDYHLLNDRLKGMQAQDMTFSERWSRRDDGSLKQWLVQQLFTVRKIYSDVWLSGEYVPLSVEGQYKDFVLAFARKLGKTWMMTVVPLYLASRQNGTSILTVPWKDTRVKLPAGAPVHWKNLITSESGEYDGSILLADLFAEAPIALVLLEPDEKKRHAGILMHISSLPGIFPLGDFGPSAYQFVDTLYRSKQSYWQLLPLNPVNEANGYSPYSSFSAMAGNTWFISPERLAQEGLLSPPDWKDYLTPSGGHVNFSEAKRIKEILLDKAWKNFQQSDDHALNDSFLEFISMESYWLHDFALFTVLSEKYKGASWKSWPLPYKNREEDALNKFAENARDEIQKEKWLQFIFDRQWKELRAYCVHHDVKLFGDLPFYMCYDSADVWANPKIFSLSEAGDIKGMAGVPPDYFNSNGQLWGMPVFDWEELRASVYAWWKQRLRKNIERFDVVRLDHFRAFAGYWEVPSGEKTAKRGQWVKGPGSDFFLSLRETFSRLPFVAEDLGEITDDVFALRDAFNLPGMKVLQFAVGDSLTSSMYAPHNFESTNFIVYTGTHDNNTTRGWFRKDLRKAHRKKLSEYVGYEITEENVAEAMIRLAYSSTANLTMIPMQDILNLDERARLNTPGSATENWKWRWDGAWSKRTENFLQGLTVLFNRD